MELVLTGPSNGDTPSVLDALAVAGVADARREGGGGVHPPGVVFVVEVGQPSVAGSCMGGWVASRVSRKSSHRLRKCDVRAGRPRVSVR